MSISFNGAFEFSVTHFNDVLVFQLAQELDFAYCGHVQAILELTNFYLFDGHLPVRTGFMTYVCVFSPFVLLK